MPYKSRLSALVSKGYFPKELPPVFSTRDFGQHVSDILDEWEAKGVYRRKSAGNVPNTSTKKSNSYLYGLDDADSEIVSMPKRGYERRNLHITHPIPHALLSYELAKNWRTVQKWLSRQTFSLDEIRISESYERSIKGINHQTHEAKKAYIAASSDWLVKTDISRFYPTIYTHSISWATYGKEQVKRNIRLYKGSLADRLDILVRSCNRNQTIGIPTGPETSRVIAEIISSRIDSDFQSTMPDIPRECIDRRQDDWFVGVNTLEKAETVLSSITAIYREYGLEINGHKTAIDRIIAASGPPWLSEIGAFLSHRPGPIRGARLSALLSLSLRMQSDFPNEPVINYVLSIVEAHHVASGDIEILESFLLKAAVIAPISMNNICRIILNLQHRTKQVSRQRIASRFAALAERNLENGNLYEVIWLVYTLRGLKMPLRSRKITELLERTASSALALIVLDMKSKGLCVCPLPTAGWVSQITEATVNSDWIWLLGYEGIRKGWLPDPTNVLTGPFFQAMASRDVSFYDPTRSVPSSTKVVRTRNRARRSQFLEVQRVMKVLRGLRFAEY
jgi:hypothetical protein